MKRILTLLSLTLFASAPVLCQKRHTPAKPAAAVQPKAEEKESVSAFNDGDSVQTTICKGTPTPDGYVIAGETVASDCPKGAWILKRRGAALHRDVPTETYAPPAGARRSRADDAEDEDEDDQPRQRHPPKPARATNGEEDSGSDRRSGSRLTASQCSKRGSIAVIS